MSTSTKSGSVISCLRISTESFRWERFDLEPVEKLSTTKTSCLPTSLSAICDPKKPAPPEINTRDIFSPFQTFTELGGQVVYCINFPYTSLIMTLISGPPRLIAMIWWIARGGLIFQLWSNFGTIDKE